MLRQQKVKPVEDQKNDTGLQFERLKSNDDSEQKVDEQELQVRSVKLGEDCFFEGQWKGNRKHGAGTLKWKSGTSYSGEFRNDKRHGKGKLIYKNGDEYDGEFQDDVMHG